MLIIKCLAGVFCWLVGYLTAIFTKQEIKPFTSAEQIKILEKENKKLIRQNQALREMLNKHWDEAVRRYMEKLDYEMLSEQPHERIQELGEENAENLG
ncbi:MAG: hypothetical protein KBT46_00925 [Ruminococcus sp.]|nr:hypothetical protein [Candidatus Copronaster equi]